jgi:UDP-N-acetylmuramoylalanine--D-glutamate ligase
MKRIVILGGGESGAGAAVLAQTKGFDVFLSDMGTIKPQYKEWLEKYQVPWEEGKHTEELILNADEVIKSPGIPDKAPMVCKIRSKGIPIISEIEFAARYTTAKKVCITGSNGKTTTTSLIYHMMQKAGLNVGLAGNIGSSFAYQVATCNFDYYVIELSSFQLDGVYDFKADIAILLNITRTIGQVRLQDAKLRGVQVPYYPEPLRGRLLYLLLRRCRYVEQLKRIVLRAQQLPFSQQMKINQAAWVENEHIFVNYNDSDFSMSIQELSLKGKHNIYNSMAAGIAGHVLNIRKEVIRESLSDFQGVEHRLEPVLKIRGVQYINDSKATNVNSTWYALESMDTPVVWIAGGIDKGNDYSELMDLVKQKVKAIVCLGVDNSKIHAAFDGVVELILDTSSAEEAVQQAYRLANPGDTVLLSPACASFDLFENYEDRGRKFKAAVRDL